MLSSIFVNFMEHFFLKNICSSLKCVIVNVEFQFLGTSWNILEFKTIIIVGLNFELCHKEQS